MIRAATLDDLGYVHELMYELHEEGIGYSGVEIDPAHIAGQLGAMLRSGMFHLHVDDAVNGYILFFLGTPWYSPKLIGSEVSLYVRRGYRGVLGAHLIKSFESFSKSHGAVRLTSGVSTTVPGVARLYCALGFTQHATEFIKEV